MKLQHQMGNLHWNLKSSIKRCDFADLYCNQQLLSDYVKIKNKTMSVKLSGIMLCP